MGMTWQEVIDNPYLQNLPFKIELELGWRPAETFETGIRKTVAWYLANPGWVTNVQNGAYKKWTSKQYALA